MQSAASVALGRNCSILGQPARDPRLGPLLRRISVPPSTRATRETQPAEAAIAARARGRRPMEKEIVFAFVLLDRRAHRLGAAVPARAIGSVAAAEVHAHRKSARLGLQVLRRRSDAKERRTRGHGTGAEVMLSGGPPGARCSSDSSRGVQRTIRTDVVDEEHTRYETLVVWLGYALVGSSSFVCFFGFYIIGVCTHFTYSIRESS